MFITLKSDYAVRIVGCLSAENRRMDARTLSENNCVSLRFALKILRKLVTADIVRSYKGTQGGYELAKPASEISVKDVIEAVEGKYTLSRCLTEEHDCNRGMSGKCQYQKVFAKISGIVEKELESYTFDMLI